MSLSNDELYRQLLDEYRDLRSRHVIGQGQRRFKRLCEVGYLLRAYNLGENILLAKLAYNPDTAPHLDDLTYQWLIELERLAGMVRRGGRK